MSSNNTKRLINFSAGPSKLPEEVLIKAQQELLNYDGSGCSVMELSHRSPTFSKIITEAEKDLRELMSVPDTHVILFVQGGGTGQFAAIPMNLVQSKDDVVDYLVTGSWSDKARKEADKYATTNQVVPKLPSYTVIPDPKSWKLSKNAKYFYHCDNETIHGVEFKGPPKGVDPSVPIVSDMSSNFMTKVVDISKYGLIYAAAQKNIGIAGLAIVIVREDLLGKGLSITPSTFDYKLTADNKSLYNTPPCFPLYITGLYLKWIKENGGIKAMEENSRKKSQLIYEAIEGSNGFYYSPVDKDCRSRVTIPFRVGGPKGDANLESQFLKDAESRGMIQLKGHRSVGGIRASVFNAMSVNETQVLVSFMLEFMKKHAH